MSSEYATCPATGTIDKTNLVALLKKVNVKKEYMEYIPTVS